MKATWSVVVVYEDNVARSKAVEFCDELVERFWTICGFEVFWWSFAQLEEAESSKEAGTKAAEADLIVFATCPTGEIPLGIQAWIESWMERRADREGTLIGLMDPGAGLGREAAQKFAYLRGIAHRAGLDYLTQVPASIARPVPDSLDSFSERADRVTGVLDEILQRPAPPPQLFR